MISGYEGSRYMQTIFRDTVAEKDGMKLLGSCIVKI